MAKVCHPAIVTLVVNGETIYTTPEHPFYVVGKGWTEAGTLQLGEWIARADGTSGVVQQINIVQHSQLMYDLTVTQAHSFFVGQQQWLVHNCGGTPRGKQAGPTVDRLTGEEVQRFVVDPRGNTMIEPQGGKTIASGPGGADTHTLYPNGSNYQRLNPVGHANNPVPHGHGHQLGVGPNMRGQGNSLDVNGNVVPWASQAAHWQIK